MQPRRTQTVQFVSACVGGRARWGRGKRGRRGSVRVCFVSCVIFVFYGGRKDEGKGEEGEGDSRLQLQHQLAELADRVLVVKARLLERLDPARVLPDLCLLRLCTVQ